MPEPKFWVITAKDANGDEKKYEVGPKHSAEEVQKQFEKDFPDHTDVEVEERK